jgi:hypothetical protein
MHFTSIYKQKELPTPEALFIAVIIVLFAYFFYYMSYTTIGHLNVQQRGQGC